jgi:hypothetical protein
VDGLDRDQLAQTTAAVVADTGAAGIPAADVIEQFLDEKMRVRDRLNRRRNHASRRQGHRRAHGRGRPRAVTIELVTVGEQPERLRVVDDRFYAPDARPGPRCGRGCTATVSMWGTASGRPDPHSDGPVMMPVLGGSWAS